MSAQATICSTAAPKAVFKACTTAAVLVWLAGALWLAVKLANVEALGATFPSVRLITTANAQENAPMIAVNEMMGFEVAAVQTLWEKNMGGQW